MRGSAWFSYIYAGFCLVLFYLVRFLLLVGSAMFMLGSAWFCLVLVSSSRLCWVLFVPHSSVGSKTPGCTDVYAPKYKYMSSMNYY